MGRRLGRSPDERSTTRSSLPAPTPRKTLCKAPLHKSPGVTFSPSCRRCSIALGATGTPRRRKSRVGQEQCSCTWSRATSTGAKALRQPICTSRPQPSIDQANPELEVASTDHPPPHLRIRLGQARVQAFGLPQQSVRTALVDAEMKVSIFRCVSPKPCYSPG